MNILGETLTFLIILCLIAMINWTCSETSPDLFVTQNFNSIIVEKTQNVVGYRFLYCKEINGEIRQVVVWEITYLKYAVGDTVKVK